MSNHSVTIVSAGLSIFICCTGASASQEPVSGPLACDFSKEESEMVTVTITNGDIEGAILSLPRDYVVSFGFRPGEERKALLMRAYNTDFKAYPNSELLTSEGKSKPLAGIHDKLSILVSDLVPINEVALNAIYSNYGLERDFSILDVHHSKLQNGLSVLPYKSRPTYQEIFLNKVDDSYSDVISCTRDGDASFPQCSHDFRSGTYDVGISYSKTHLDRWQELRDGASRLLQCFTIKEPVQLEEK